MRVAWNTNDYVEFELTPAGRERWAEYMKELREIHGTEVVHCQDYKQNPAGVLRMQGWCMLLVFKSMFGGMGTPIPFLKNRLILENVDEVAPRC